MNSIYLFQNGKVIYQDNDDNAGFRIPANTIKKYFSDIEIFETVPGAVFAATLPGGRALPASCKAVPVRQALTILCGGGRPYTGEGEPGRLLRAFHIAQWRDESRFCGSCGEKNGDAGDELARLCPRCGRREYPRISPAVITIIVNDRDEALLAHNCKFKNGMYSLIAGFTEAGESLEDTVARETREEVGITLKDIRYVSSQPWPFPNSLMLGFTARRAGGTLRPDGVEIEDARWFSRDALPELPGYGSVSRLLIELWRERKL